jgi:lysophospholipase L1-like esterase
VSSTVRVVGATGGGGGGGTTTVVSGASTAQTPLLRAYANFAARDVAPAIVHVCGDSFSSNLSASLGWATKLSTTLQTMFPKITGTSPAITTDLTTARGSRGTGVQIVNSAVSGTTSANFINSTTRPQIAALQPCLYVWMIGENDPANGITPAVHKSNLLSEISYQKTNNPRPHAFLLVFPYQRPSYAGASPWADYGLAEAEIAAADPTNVLFLDASALFAQAGVPGADPNGLVDTDNFHPSSSGMTLFADLVWGAIRPTTPLSSSTSGSSSSGTVLSNTALPVITGTATEGQVLTASTGTWSATPDSYTYQWRRGGSAISGATSSTYTLVTADVGSSITVTVTAAKAGYTSGSATSAATGTVTSAGSGGGSGTLTDTFNRTDSASAIGTPSDGGAAYVVTGTWGINGNAAYCPGASAKVWAMRPLSGGTGMANASVEVVVAGSGLDNSAIALLNTDGSGYVLFISLGGNAQLWKVDAAGTFSAISGLGNPTVTVGDTVKLVKTGSSLQALKNGVQMGTTQTDSTYPTVVRGGLYIYQPNTTVRYDSLTLTAS